MLHRVQDWISDHATRIFNLDLLHAFDDALRETEMDPDCTPAEMANAHEAAAELDLWLRHMAWDFGAINDLTPELRPIQPVIGPN